MCILLLHRRRSCGGGVCRFDKSTEYIIIIIIISAHLTALYIRRRWGKTFFVVLCNALVIG